MNEKCISIRCFWAGMLIETHPVTEENSTDKIISDLQSRLSEGRLTFLQYGVTHVLSELCLDGVWKNGNTFRLCDLKK